PAQVLAGGARPARAHRDGASRRALAARDPDDVHAWRRAEQRPRHASFHGRRARPEGQATEGHERWVAARCGMPCAEPCGVPFVPAADEGCFVGGAGEAPEEVRPPKRRMSQMTRPGFFARLTTWENG